MVEEKKKRKIFKDVSREFQLWPYLSQCLKHLIFGVLYI